MSDAAQRDVLEATRRRLSESREVIAGARSVTDMLEEQITTSREALVRTYEQLRHLGPGPDPSLP